MSMDRIRSEVEGIAFLVMHQKVTHPDEILDADAIKREVVTIVDNLLVFKNPVLEEVSDMIIVVVVDRVVDDLMDRQKRKAFIQRSGTALSKLWEHVRTRRARNSGGVAEDGQAQLPLTTREERTLSHLVDVSRASVIISTPEAVINDAIEAGTLMTFGDRKLRIEDIKALAIDRAILKANL